MSAEVQSLGQPLVTAPEMSDEAVAYACAAAEPTAIAELFRRFHEPVARYLSRIVSEPADVEDLVQATFLEVARGAAKYAGRSQVKTWLFGIATNLTHGFWRKARRRLRFLEDFRVAFAAFSDDASPGVADAMGAAAQARRALELLPGGQREALVLCELEGLTAREAAEVLGTSEAAVWKRVSHARATILRHVRERQL